MKISNTRELQSIRLAQEEGDDALEDTLIAFKDHLDGNIWMLQAYLGKEVFEDDDNYDDDDEE